MTPVLAHGVECEGFVRHTPLNGQGVYFEKGIVVACWRRITQEYNVKPLNICRLEVATTKDRVLPILLHSICSSKKHQGMGLARLLINWLPLKARGQGTCALNRTTGTHLELTKLLVRFGPFLTSLARGQKSSISY